MIEISSRLNRGSAAAGRASGGMRISVNDMLSWLAAGMTNRQIIDEYPELTHDDIRAALAYDADRVHDLVGSLLQVRGEKSELSRDRKGAVRVT